MNDLAELREQYDAFIEELEALGVEWLYQWVRVDRGGMDMKEHAAILKRIKEWQELVEKESRKLERKIRKAEKRVNAL